MDLFFRVRASVPDIIRAPRDGFRISLRFMLAMPPDEEITSLLAAWGEGDDSALERLVPAVEAELRGLAAHYMRGERAGHTLQTTALINEVYLRLVDGPRVGWQGRAHFFGVAARLMREILVDYARSRRRLKRGAGATRVSLSA